MRSQLFQTALCVVYTPDKEHFGIVPLEAMYAGTPVLAVNSGGPTETVVDSRTGFLREPTPQAFAGALEILIQDPQRATVMGKQARIHVEKSFGADRFREQWDELVLSTQERKSKRKVMPSGALIVPLVSMLFLVVSIIFILWIITGFVLRSVAEYSSGRVLAQEL
uniref:Glycosyl transferase family 1 domain-containing protein n=1 Tax=Craspedostauros australis TaxID=1486917 RepID=A0A7R9ZNG3_9STRA|mmetsp:Transcript_19744/g.54912  ORF Transcript_19744/g.54912 Transcript_19744/m.54912 type:complete len:166 (+) Transcript_19744:2-499(+)